MLKYKFFQNSLNLNIKKFIQNLKEFNNIFKILIFRIIINIFFNNIDNFKFIMIIKINKIIHLNN